MINYRIIQNNKDISIFETRTETIIKTFKEYKKAKKFMKHLNLGGGFDGWSPTFILKSVYK